MIKQIQSFSDLFLISIKSTNKIYYCTAYLINKRKWNVFFLSGKNKKQEVIFMCNQTKN